MNNTFFSRIELLFWNFAIRMLSCFRIGPFLPFEDGPTDVQSGYGFPVGLDGDCGRGRAGQRVPVLLPDRKHEVTMMSRFSSKAGQVSLLLC